MTEMGLTEIMAEANRLYNAGAYEKSLDYYGILACFMPESTAAHWNLGMALKQSGDEDGAKRRLLRAVRLGGGHYYWRAVVNGFGHLVEEANGDIIEIAGGLKNDRLYHGEPDWGEPATVEMLDEVSPRPRFKIIRWPYLIKIPSMEALFEAIHQHNILGDPMSPPFISPGDSAFTFGSCFSVSIGRALDQKNVNVTNMNINESVNSSFANRYFFEWLLEGDTSRLTNYFHRQHGEEGRQRLSACVANADFAVMTVGVAPCFFHTATGEFGYGARKKDNTGFDFLEGEYRLRMTTVQENVENIQLTVERIRRLRKDLRIVISVSPIPLSGIAQCDGIVGETSIFSADCISKSVMRLAANEICLSNKDIIYWPSFEIVRWLSAHCDFSVFGDDGTANHVNGAVVDMIVSLFMEYYAKSGKSA